jgi:TonB-dependent SusC/RagA subfamily outer membrane receptor
MRAARYGRPRTSGILRGLVPALSVFPGIASLPAHSPAQQLASLRGRVTELAAGRPLPETRVAIVGTSLVATTDPRGAFEFRNLTPGPILLRFEHPTHATLIERIDVRAGEERVIAVALPSRAFVLEQLAVVGRPAADASERPATTSLSEVLDDVAGVQLVRAGGAVGQTYYLRIRGVNSFSFSAAPAVYVDGIRVSFGVGADAANVLELISPLHVGRIEVLRGSSAPAQYGPDAMNGVILVTTKRGRP